MESLKLRQLPTPVIPTKLNLQQAEASEAPLNSTTAENLAGMCTHVCMYDVEQVAV